MIVTCPSCSKRYMLDGGTINPEGRQVRCASCQHVWRYVPDEVTSIRPLPFLGFPHGESIVDARPFTKKRFSWIKWSLLGLTLALLCFFIFCRHTVVTLWPESQKGYTLLGLSARLPGEGLKISNPTSLVYQEGATDMIVVAGDILNTSNQVQTIPPLQITLMGNIPLGSATQEGQILDHWEHRLAESSLLPGETLHFEAAPRPKVAGAKHVLIVF